MLRRSPALALAAAVILTACVTPEESGQRQPEATDDGVQVTGAIDGARVAITSGAPDVTFGDCDGGDGLDADVCWVARTIDGLSVAFVIENPAVLTVGTAVPVRDDACSSDCDGVTGHAVIDLRVNGTQRRASGGTITASAVGVRYAAELQITFASGDMLSGTFNIRQPVPGEE